MPDSETESKHFFRILGLFSKKVFRLQLFVSIVGLAEAVPAGDAGTPFDPRRGRVQSTAPRSRDVGQEPLPERPFLMVGRRQGATWAAEGQWLRPSRFGLNGLNPRQIFKIHPRKNRICFRIFQSLIYLNRGELTKNPTVFRDLDRRDESSVRQGFSKKCTFPPFFRVSVKSA